MHEKSNESFSFYPEKSSRGGAFRLVGEQMVELQKTDVLYQ